MHRIAHTSIQAIAVSLPFSNTYESCFFRNIEVLNCMDMIDNIVKIMLIFR